MKNPKKSQKEKRIEWWDDAVAIPNPYEESKPHLPQKEIENAAKVHATFVDPKYQMHFGWLIKDRYHRETYWEFWRLSCRNNRNPVDHPYSVDQHIIDKGLAPEVCNNTDCGNCGCD